MDDKSMQPTTSLFRLRDRIFDTGEICPKCGTHIMGVKFFDTDGRARIFRRPCACRDAEIKAENAAEAAAKAEENRRKRYAWSDLPQLFCDATLNGYRRLPGTEQAYELVKSYLIHRKENFSKGNGIILMGAVGCGKTHLGCAILNCALEDGYRAVYWNVPKLLEMLMPGNADEVDQTRVLEKAFLADVLLMDDLGAEKPSLWTQKELVIILDERYRENKPTIITSNLLLNDKELRSTCGDRAYSRLCSDHFQAVALTAEDYRRRKI